MFISIPRMGDLMSTNKSTKVEVKNLTKIFGKRIAKAKELSSQGKDKSEILKETAFTF